MNPGLGDVPFGQRNTLQGFRAEPRQNLGAQPRQKFGAQPRQNLGGEPLKNLGVQPRQNLRAQLRQSHGAQPRQNLGGEPRQNLGGEPFQRSGVQPEIRATRPTQAPRGPTVPSVTRVAHSPARGRGNGVSRISEPVRTVNCGGHRAPSCAKCPGNIYDYRGYVERGG